MGAGSIGATPAQVVALGGPVKDAAKEVIA
jgi:hypothetical protein